MDARDVTGTKREHPPAGNLLSAETSPYLLQHAENPVAWRPWGEAAFSQARAEGRPILLSVGYAACHWCHVMAHESFEDPATAEIINALFVPIKVDREERPDVDLIYQSALSALGQQGGWPLTMFLTPEAEPFWGGTYFPPSARGGRPGFPEILRAVAQTYHGAPEKVAQNGRALREALQSLGAGTPAEGDGLDPGILDDLAAEIVPRMDPRWGGLSGAPKFPQTGILRLLWRAHLRSGRDDARDAVMRALAGLLEGGIWDHLGGGLARYSTDETWLVPHFEKMLYDNAQLLALLALVTRAAPHPLFAERAEALVGWLDRDMTIGPAGQGGFAAALDADSEGEEGRYYVWTEAEIDAALGQDADAFKAEYDVAPGGNWEGRSILNRRHAIAAVVAGPHDPPPGSKAALLARSRRILLDRRAGRVPPGRDDKLLADWNGLMIAALAEAGCAFDRPSWVGRAAAAFDHVAATLETAPGRLAHSWRAGRHGPPGLLDDYAAMARAGLALYEATGAAHYMDRARGWVDTLDRHFAHPDGGYAMTPDDGEALIVRIRTAFDNATPSGNGVALGVLARLWHLTGAPHYEARARDLIRAFAGGLDRGAFALASWIDAALTLDLATLVVVAGRPGDPQGAALLAAARRDPGADLIVLPIDPSASSLPQGHPATGKGLVDGAAAAYVCRDFICQPPVTDPAALHAILRTRVARRSAEGGDPA